MRIGYFTSIVGWGGSEMYLKTLMLALRQEGHEPVLIGIEGSRLFQELQAERIECHSWSQLINSLDKAQDRSGQAVTRDIRGRLRRLKSKMLCLLPGWVKLLAGNVREVGHLRRTFNNLGIDVLQVTVHGYEVAGLAARLCGLPVVAVYQISPVEQSSFIRSLLIQWTARTYHSVCFVSRYSAVKWQTITGLDSRKCVVVPNGADLQSYVGCGRDIPRDARGVFRLVSVGRLHPMKGYRYLIEAMACLNDPTVTLVILGEGVEEFELRQLACDLGVAPAIRFCGYVDNPADFLREADCFVLASVSHEGSPFVLAEAMAAGLPLITSDFGPLPEINIHNETGLVVPMRDSQALADGIRALRDNPELACRMGKAARNRAMQYDQRQMVSQMLAQYKMVKQMTK